VAEEAEEEGIVNFEDFFAGSIFDENFLVRNGSDLVGNVSKSADRRVAVREEHDEDTPPTEREEDEEQLAEEATAVFIQRNIFGAVEKNIRYTQHRQAGATVFSLFELLLIRLLILDSCEIALLN
jgi:TATA-binding protein-associated factor Taf7